MLCPACGEANRPGRLYCARCGPSITVACAACEAGEQFCGQCGTRLHGDAPPSGSSGSGNVVPPPARAPTVPRTPRATVVAPESLAAGRYRIGRLLGEGGKKRVYLATDTRLERDVAIALVKTEGLDEHGLQR